jgi:hypothetical protein
MPRRRAGLPTSAAATSSAGWTETSDGPAHSECCFGADGVNFAEFVAVGGVEECADLVL